MEKSFVSFIDCSEEGTYNVAIGNQGSWEETQFIEIEFTDSGKIIRFFDDSSLDKLEQKFHEYVTNITNKSYKNEFRFFIGNETMKDTLDKYKSLGVEYVHDSDCKCVACQKFDGYNFRGDTINRVINELGEKK